MSGDGPQDTGKPQRMRWPDFLLILAVIVILVSLLVSEVLRRQEQRRRTQVPGNLSGMGLVCMPLGGCPLVDGSTSARPLAALALCRFAGMPAELRVPVETD